MKKIFLIGLGLLSVFTLEVKPASHAPEDIVVASSMADVQKAIISVGSGTSFSFYDLHLSSQELEELKSIQVKKEDQYDNFGDSDILSHELTVFLKEIGNNEKISEKVSRMITRIVQNLIAASGQETSWVCVRSSVPNQKFDIPRWHTDGYYYKPHENQYKFAVVLKGPSTLFYDLPSTEREEFYKLTDGDAEFQMNKANRQKVDAFLKDPSKRFQSDSNQGGVFVVGCSDTAAVHSEPAMPVERLFLSVLPGSRKQIAEWQSR